MKKRLFAVALTALLPAIGMLAYNEVWYREQRNAEIHAQAAQSSLQVASEVDRILEGTRSLLIATSAIPAVADLDPEPCREALAQIANQVAPIRTIIVLDLQGRLVCDSIRSRGGMDLSDRTYFKEALTSSSFVIGEFTKSRVSGAMILPIARALKKDGELRGVLVTGLRLEWLQERIRERGLLPGGAVVIADRKGIILARNPEPEKFVGTPVFEDFMRLVHAEAPGTVEITGRDGIVRVVGYEPVSPTGSPLYIASGISRDAAFEPINRATTAAVMLIVLGGLAAAVAAVVVGNRFILLPIQKVVSVLERWAGGELDARTGMHGRHGEVGQVGASVDNLLDELDRRRTRADKAEASRAFMSRELSHRVKNTLSVVQAIARQTFGRIVPPEAIETYSLRVRALAGAYDTLLAEDWQRGDIGDVVATALSPHHGHDDDRFRISGPQISLPPQAVISLSLVLHELATNAAKYGALHEHDGYVEIIWMTQDNRITLDWIEHDGPPLMPPDREGFGTKVIKRAFPPEFKPEITFDYQPDGLRFTLAFTPVCPDNDGSDDPAT